VSETGVLTCVKESAGKTLEEMDLLFTKGRTPWVFLDREATKIGAIFERDLSRGEALIVDAEKGAVDVAVAVRGAHTEDEKVVQTEEAHQEKV
jgi:hypothetical protein